MGLSRLYFVESKSLEFVMEGVPVLRVYESSRGLMCSVSMGKACALWLLAVMEEVPRAEASKEFLKSFRAGSNAFIVQRCMKRSGLFGHQ